MGSSVTCERRVGRPLTTRSDHVPYSRLSLRESFVLILLFLALHNSILGLSWLLERSYMPVFKALKRLMYRLREVQPTEMSGAVESDEVYVTAGLKGRNSSHHIRRLGRKPRRKGLKKRRVSDGSTVYTDCFKAYLGLGKAGYKHEAVNHLAGEYVRGECHINGCENRAFLFRPWLAVHRGVCKENLSFCLAAFKACRRSRKIRPKKAILKTALIFIMLLVILGSHSGPEAAILED